METYHVIEHLPRNEVLPAIKDWQRTLTPGGQLIIECPDFDVAVQGYINGNAAMLDSIYGLQRFTGDAHLWGFNKARLVDLLQSVGFVDVQSEEPTDYHVNREPCMRVVATKTLA